MSSTCLAQAAQPVDTYCPRHASVDSLLARVGDGDRRAFAALYDAVSQTIYAMCLRRGHEPWLSAEVTYEVFLRAWQQARSYDPEAGSAWMWLRAIALDAIDGPTDAVVLSACRRYSPNQPT